MQSGAFLFAHKMTCKKSKMIRSPSLRRERSSQTGRFVLPTDICPELTPLTLDAVWKSHSSETQHYNITINVSFAAWKPSLLFLEIFHIQYSAPRAHLRYSTCGPMCRFFFNLLFLSELLDGSVNFATRTPALTTQGLTWTHNFLSPQGSKHEDKNHENHDNQIDR